MNDTNFEKVYTDTVSKFGRDVFREFLGVLSRKRQTNLLISSAITILLSFAIVEPVESQFAGIKFAFTDIKVIPIIAGIFCSYFLITYLINALQDWQLEKYRTMPARVNSQKLLQKFQEEFEQRELIFEQILSETKNKRDILAKAREELKNRKHEMDEQMAVIHKRHASELIRMAKKGTSPAKLKQIREKQLKEQWETMFSMVNIPDLENVLDPSTKTPNPIPDGDTLSDKSNFLVRSFYWYFFFRNMNVLIEIIFPSALALFAIGSVIWKVTQ